MIIILSHMYYMYEEVKIQENLSLCLYFTQAYLRTELFNFTLKMCALRHMAPLERWVGK
jgi:hypothetical protein